MSVKGILRNWLRPFSGAPRSIDEALPTATAAWFSALERYRNPLGAIQLPHPAQALTEKETENCRVLPDRNVVLQKMKRGGVVAEVGVQTGRFSRTILDICSPSKLHLIDIDLTRHSIDRQFENEIASGIAQLHQGDSSSILRDFPDSYFDFVYIDADHSYEGVKRDIQAGISKVKHDGFLVFNDYTYWSPAECMPYGVIQAVNELCLEGEWEMIYFALAYYMYCDVALKRRQPMST